jgi:retron-type reverse transcriptase
VGSHENTPQNLKNRAVNDGLLHIEGTRSNDHGKVSRKVVSADANAAKKTEQRADAHQWKRFIDREVAPIHHSCGHGMQWEHWDLGREEKIFSFSYFFIVLFFVLRY